MPETAKRRRAGPAEAACARDLKEINDFWMEVVRDPEEKITNRLKASELRAKTAEAALGRREQSQEKAVKVVLEGEAAELAQ